MKLRYLISIGASLIAFTASASAGNILLNSDFAAKSDNWTVAGNSAHGEFVTSSTIHMGFDGGNGFSWYTNNTAGITVTQTVKTSQAGDFVLSGDFLQRSDAHPDYNHATWTLKLLDADSKVIPEASQTGTFPGAGVLKAPSQSVTKSYSNLPAGTYTVQYTIASGQGAVDNVKLDFSSVSGTPSGTSSGALLGLGDMTLILRSRK